MMGKIYLGGGGNENVAFEVEENFFKDVTSVLYIPLAWPNNDFNSCLNWFSKMASSHKKIEIEMLDDTNKKIDFSKFDGVYIGGGNTFKLLKKLKESEIGKELINFYESGGKIFGGSAGAIIWGNDIGTSLLCKDKDTNEVGLEDTSGFDKALGYDVQCHFEENQITEHKEYSKKTGRKILAIPEQTAVIIDEGKLKVIGSNSVTVIDNEKYMQFSPGSIITF